MAGREGFEPSRELYTPYPLTRRVLSATQPPPRQGGAVARFYPPQALSILSSRWMLPADQARLRRGALVARWPSGRPPVREARCGTRSPAAASARPLTPFSTISRFTNCVFSSPLA